MPSKKQSPTLKVAAMRNERRIVASIAKRANSVKSRAKNVAKKVKNSVFDLNGAISDISGALTRSLSNPTVLLTALAVLAVVVTQSTIFEATGVIGKWTTANPENPLAIWIVANKTKFVGLLIALPTVLASPKHLQVLLAIASFFWVIVVPESTVYQYLFQSLALHAYFRVSHPSSRTVIIAGTALAYYLGWIVVK